MCLTLKGCTGYLVHPFLHQETGECMRSREEDSLVGRAAFRACFPWQTQLSKKRDFLPILFPVRV
jgi:hypothetical protein